MVKKLGKAQLSQFGNIGANQPFPVTIHNHIIKKYHHQIGIITMPTITASPQRVYLILILYLPHLCNHKSW